MVERTQAYRAYHLGADGRIRSVEVLTASNDLEALTRLRSIPNQYGIELWDCARIVGRAAPTQTVATSAA